MTTDSGASKVANMTEQETALALAEAQAPLALFGTNDPVEVIAIAARVATALAEVVNKRGLFAVVNQKKFPTVEAWTLLGSMLGVFPITEWVHELRNEDGSVRGFEARVRAQTLAGRTVGAGEARCIRGESKTWHSNAQEFALSSMAQTRATSKALRGPLDFVFKLAGFQPTPAEEMDSQASGEIAFDKASAASVAALQAEQVNRQAAGATSPPAPSQEAQGSDLRQSGGSDSPPSTAIQEPAAAVTPAPPGTAGVDTPVSAAAASTKGGQSSRPPQASGSAGAPAAHSTSGPRAKRGNVVAAPVISQGAQSERSATGVVRPPAMTSAPPVVSLDAPLEGQEQYLDELRRQARQAAAVIRHLQVKRENLLKTEQINLGTATAQNLPVLTPNLEADDSLRQFVAKRYPGRQLVDLGEAELDGSDDAPGVLRALQSIIDALHAKGFHE